MASFKADRETIDRVMKCDVSIQHWSNRAVQLDLEKQSVLETVRSLGAAKTQILREAVVAAGFPADKVVAAKLNVRTGDVEVAVSGDPEATTPEG